MHWLSKRRYKIAFLIPSLLVYTLFIVVPIFVGIGYSFTKYTGIGKARFTGLSNYQRLFHDKLFWTSLRNTVLIFVVASLLLLVLSFALALLLHSRLKFSDTSTALLFSPACHWTRWSSAAVDWWRHAHPLLNCDHLLLATAGLPNDNFYCGIEDDSRRDS